LKVLSTMSSPYEKIISSVINGAVFPLLFYGFRVNPWSDPKTYWVVAVISFVISFSVYSLRKERENSHRVRNYLINSFISFILLFIVGAIYFVILVALHGFV
jgi:hypothetical protein